MTLPASVTTVGCDSFEGCSSFTTLIIVSDHAEPKVLKREQPFDTNAVQQALGLQTTGSIEEEAAKGLAQLMSEMAGGAA